MHLNGTAERLLPFPPDGAGGLFCNGIDFHNSPPIAIANRAALIKNRIEGYF